MDMDTTTATLTVTDTPRRLHPARPAVSSPAARPRSPAGVRSLAAGAAESLARGLVTCVFATVGTVLGAITGGLLGLATETGVVRGTGVGGITGALVSMEVVDSYLAIWRSDEPAIWSVVYVLDVIWSLLTGRLVREKVDPAVLSAVESQVRVSRSRYLSTSSPTLTLVLRISVSRLNHVTLLLRDTDGRLRTADERGGDAGRAPRRRRHLRDGRHQRHGEGGHRRAPGGEVRRPRQRRRRRRAHRLLGLPPGVPRRREREEPAGVPPHVPPAVHRRMAAPARLLPHVPARALGTRQSVTLSFSVIESSVARQMCP